MKFQKLEKIIINKEEIKAELTKEEKQRLKEEKKLKRQEEKELRKEDKKVLKSTKELLPILDIDEEGIFITKNGYLSIYQIETKDIYAFNEYETKIHIYNFVAFLRNYVDDIKLVCMNFPVNTTKQQEFIQKKIKESTKEVYRNFLNEKLEQFVFLEEHRNNKEYFIVVFSKDREEVKNTIYKNQSRALIFRNIDIEKKIKILFKLNNLNTKLM